MTARDHEPLTPEERALAQRLSRLGTASAPSASLDASILAAAREATAPSSAPSRGRSAPRRARWPFGVGIAASLAVAMGIAWQLRPQPEQVALPALSEHAPLPDAHILEARRAPAPAAADAQAGPDAGMDASAGAASAEPVRALESPAAQAAEHDRYTVPPADAAPVMDEELREQAARTETERDAQAATQAKANAAAAERPQRAEAMPALASPPPPPPPPPPPAPAPPAPVMAPVIAPAAVPKPAATESRAFTPSPPAGVASPNISGGTAATPAARERKAVVRATATDPAEDARPALDRIEVTGSRIDQPLDDQPLDDRPPASADSPEVRDAWLRRIRELRSAGKLDDARASLREFARRHPDTPVPADLQALLDDE